MKPDDDHEVVYEACSAGRKVRPALLVVITLWCGMVMAAPYIPTNDNVVLEQVPARGELDRLEPLRRRVSSNPHDLAASTDLAKAYLEIGRSAGDPRFVGYAQAVLLPWMQRAAVPEPVLILQAIALQNQHQFAAALALLDRAALLNSLDAQLWLTRAAIYALHNDPETTRPACARLTRTADSLIALTCLTGINSRNGQLANSYHALRNVFSNDARLPADLRSWVLTQLADMAERSGDDAAAEQYYLAALQATPEDNFALAAYADWLLRVGRNSAVLRLLANREAQDNLLLRMAIAGKRLNSNAGTRWRELYAARIAAAKRDGDTVHIREQAMFVLSVENNATAALQIARLNWQTQREPADVRLYAEAARIANASRDTVLLQQWLAEHHYEDVVLQPAAVRTAMAVRP